MHKIIFTLTLITFPNLLWAQARDIVNSYVDSLAVIRKALSDTALDEKKQINPYYYQMFFPTTYYSSAAHNIFSLNSDDELTHMNFQLVHLYATMPSVAGHYDGQFENATLVQATTEAAPADDIRSVISQAKAENTPASKSADDLEIGLQVRRPNFWKTSGNFSLQFTQNYFSENWYKGGDNNITMLASIALNATYNDTKRITWENKLDMRLGFVTTKSDTCHSFLTNNDRIQLNTKLGIKAAKSWKYTISGEAKTQFLPGYRSNNRLTYSKFFSPLDVYVSTGMDFNPALKNGNSLSVAILPLSYKLRYIASHDENIHKVNRFVNRTTTQDYGSKLEVNCKFTIVKNLTWKCRGYYFTSYEYTEAELENSFSFAFSKYISSDLYTLWRFDDNRGRKYYDDNLGYFQFKEYFTLGLKYSF
ncbi:MAG: DUF3078 domain-containing protein [Bacteroidaceae bacterium]|nr:DUF3078 domain-containing protein [Bacteroidaceae bacterium]